MGWGKSKSSSSSGSSAGFRGPRLEVTVLEARGLFDPRRHFKDYTSFSARAVARLAQRDSGNGSGGMKVLAERKSGVSKGTEKDSAGKAGTVAPWSASKGLMTLPLPSAVDDPEDSLSSDGSSSLQLRASLDLVVEVWRKVFKEYFDAGDVQDALLGRCGISVRDLVLADTPYDFWYELGTQGRAVRLRIVRKGRNWNQKPPAPAPAPAPAQQQQQQQQQQPPPAVFAQHQQHQPPAVVDYTAPPAGGPPPSVAAGGGGQFDNSQQQSSAFPALAALGTGSAAAASASAPPAADGAPRGPPASSTSYPDLISFDPVVPAYVPKENPDFQPRGADAYPGAAADYNAQQQPPAAAYNPASAPASMYYGGGAAPPPQQNPAAATAPVQTTHPRNIAARLDADLASRIVVCDVTLCRLADDRELLKYMAFAGPPDRWLRRGNHIGISFPGPAGAESAVLLDNGQVAGGLLRVFRYTDGGGLDAHVMRSPPARGDVEALLGSFPSQAQPVDGSGSSSSSSGSAAPPPRPPKASRASPATGAGGAGAGAGAGAAPEALGTRVRFSQISPEATVETMASFVAYCGETVSVALYAAVPGSLALRECLVEFKSAAATSTALLLDGALIHNMPISVAETTNADLARLQDTAQFNPVGVVGAQPAAGAAARDGASKESVFASMGAAGYNLGASAGNRAKAWDQAHGGYAGLLGNKAAATAASLGNSVKSGFGFFGKKG